MGSLHVPPLLCLADVGGFGFYTGRCSLPVAQPGNRLVVVVGGITRKRWARLTSFSVVSGMGAGVGNRPGILRRLSAAAPTLVTCGACSSGRS